LWSWNNNLNSHKEDRGGRLKASTRMHVSPSKVSKCTCYAMHFHAHELIKLRVQPMHDMMMLKAYQHNLILSIHVLYVHKVVRKIKMKTFKIARSNTIEIRISLARIA
jgi:hypothetical protein